MEETKLKLWPKIERTVDLMFATSSLGMFAISGYGDKGAELCPMRRLWLPGTRFLASKLTCCLLKRWRFSRIRGEHG